MAWVIDDDGGSGREEAREEGFIRERVGKVDIIIFDTIISSYSMDFLRRVAWLAEDAGYKRIVLLPYCCFYLENAGIGVDSVLRLFEDAVVLTHSLSSVDWKRYWQAIIERYGERQARKTVVWWDDYYAFGDASDVVEKACSHLVVTYRDRIVACYIEPLRMTVLHRNVLESYPRLRLAFGLAAALRGGVPLEKKLFTGFFFNAYRSLVESIVTKIVQEVPFNISTRVCREKGVDIDIEGDKVRACKEIDLVSNKVVMDTTYIIDGRFRVKGVICVTYDIGGEFQGAEGDVYIYMDGREFRHPNINPDDGSICLGSYRPPQIEVGEELCGFMGRVLDRIEQLLAVPSSDAYPNNFFNYIRHKKRRPAW